MFHPIAQIIAEDGVYIIDTEYKNFSLCHFPEPQPLESYFYLDLLNNEDHAWFTEEWAKRLAHFQKSEKSNKQQADQIQSQGGQLFSQSKLKKLGGVFINKDKIFTNSS